ncbi:MAG TPA: DUF3108 domain-containing protein [Dehalococcoidia bacterium]|nr:DUF3108 domain-containing protein [Dehalococcoidia bacterium]
MACTSGEAGPATSDVAGAAPWGAPEKYTYALVDDDGGELGTGVLTVSVEDDVTRLIQTFSSDAAHDTIEVVVDSATLKPISSLREIEETDGDETRIEVEYTEDGALIKQNDDKQSGLSVPEHSYDNDTSLFLWRTLPFAEGYQGSYNTIITNHRTRQKVNLRVTGLETVIVPAGTFEAWRLVITTSNARQIAWFADTPERPLVRYDNDRDVIFELTETR